MPVSPALFRFRIGSKPLRTVLRWQLLVAAVGALVAGGLGGLHAALSALLGGGIPWVAGLAYAVVVSGVNPDSAGDTLRRLIRGESLKVLLIVFQCWLVFTTYRNLVVAAFLTTFVAGIAVFAMAVAVRDR